MEKSEKGYDRLANPYQVRIDIADDAGSVGGTTPAASEDEREE